MKRSLCNELFGNIPFSKQCQITAQAGLEGLELAPFTVADEKFLFPASLAKSLKKDLDDNNLGFAGLHWLLAKPDGLLITSKSASKRQEAVDFLLRLADFSEELGGGILTLGGPKQRRTEDGVSVAEATKYLNEAFIYFSEQFEKHCPEGKTKLAIETLSPAQTNVINTFVEARVVLENAGKFATSMFDFHNTPAETEDLCTVISKNIDIIEHVHVNRMDGSCPDQSDIQDFRPKFQTLEQLGYKGWYSLEIFTTPDDPLSLAKQYKQFMESCI
ncbi:MAG: sugar phosphate isomerase/epimerase [Sphaerochaetaceae bacterium]|nr:sugar phosphate isomerase/epimerase [Sphaerochaetaceae bacterium]